MTQIRDSNTTPSPSAPLPSKKFLFSTFDWGKELLSVDNTTKKNTLSRNSKQTRLETWLDYDTTSLS